MLVSDNLSSNTIKCFSFIDFTHFRGKGRNPYNNFIAFLENLRHHNFVLRLSDLKVADQFLVPLNCMTDHCGQQDTLRTVVETIMLEWNWCFKAWQATSKTTNGCLLLSLSLMSAELICEQMKLWKLILTRIYLATRGGVLLVTVLQHVAKWTLFIDDILFEVVRPPSSFQLLTNISINI